MNNLRISNVDQARKCLALIRDIAERGANSSNQDHVSYALEELSQVLFERTGSEERVFEPDGKIGDVSALLEELEFVDCYSQDMYHRSLC